MNRIPNAIIILYVFYSFGCSSEKPETTRSSDKDQANPTECEEKEAALTQIDPPAEDVTTFNDIKPLFSKYCIECHGKDKDPAAPRISNFADFSADNFLMARLAVSSVQAFRMPKAPEQDIEDTTQKNFGNTLMEPTERQTFLKWAQNGFLENKDSKPVEDKNWNVSQKPTYRDNIAPAILANCLTCHEDGQQPPQLSDFEQMKAEEYKLALDIVVEVLEGDMPKLSPLSQPEQLMFQLWALQGFRNVPEDPIKYRNSSLTDVLDVPDDKVDSEETQEKDDEATDRCK